MFEEFFISYTKIVFILDESPLSFYFSASEGLVFYKPVSHKKRVIDRGHVLLKAYLVLVSTKLSSI